MAERFIYAAFLAGMPFIYLAVALMQKDSYGIAIEFVVVPVFVGLAAYGYFRSFAVLGVGIQVDKPDRCRDDSMWFEAKSMYDKAGFTEVARRNPHWPVVRIKPA